MLGELIILIDDQRYLYNNNIHQIKSQVATRCSLFVQNVCTKCLDLSGHTGRHGRSEQLVATGRATGSPRFKFQPCRAIIMSCRVANYRDTYVMNELYCRFVRVSPCDWRHRLQPLLLLSAILWKTISYGRGEYPLRDVRTLFVLEIIHLFVTCYAIAADLGNNITCTSFVPQAMCRSSPGLDISNHKFCPPWLIKSVDMCSNTLNGLL